MNKVLPFIKSNLVAVVAIALAVIAAPVAWFFASGMAAEHRELAQERARSADRAIASAEIDYEIPALEADEEPWSATAAPNPQLIRDVVERRRSVREQSEMVREAIIERNRAGKDVLVPFLFPEPEGGESGPRGRVQLIANMKDAWGELSDRLAESAGAGLPPERAELSQRLNSLRERLVNEKTSARVDQTLSAEEEEEIAERLAEERRRAYQARAQELRFYADPNALFASRSGFDPSVTLSRETYLEEFWNWQHTAWVEQDIMAALTRANEDAGPLTGPLKRVLSINVPELEYSEVNGGSLTEPVPPDFSATFTGRLGSNAFYDVRYARVRLIASAGRINQIINAFSVTNFMTVVSMDVAHLGVNPDLLQGFEYGDEPVALVEMTVETVWVRDWYEELLPPSVREKKGLPPLEDEAAEGDA